MRDGRMALRRHRLSFIPNLAVDPVVLQPLFHATCAMKNCNGNCCSEGVLVDVEEKKKILANADLIRRYLEPAQEKDSERWFDGVRERDPDFPSGECEGTAANDHGCVFLDSRGLCALQKCAMGEGLPKFHFKPMYCVAYPLTIDAGVLTVEDPDFTNRPQCCSSIDSGSQTVLDVCEEELEYLLGAEGAEELADIVRRKASPPAK